MKSEMPVTALLFVLLTTTAHNCLAQTNQFIATGSMSDSRAQGHSLTLLQNGKVLVAGGIDYDGESLSSAELYDPAAEEWTTTGSTSIGRYHSSTVLLADGRVLIAGSGYSGDHDTVEIYDPTTGLWTATGSLVQGRYSPCLALLPSGKVFTIGGAGTSGSAEIYDPTTGVWTATTPMTNAGNHASALLQDGRVLVAASLNTGPPMSPNYISVVEIYNPTTGQWTATGDLVTPRAYGMAMTKLSDGRVLVAGGFGSGGTLASAEIYDPATGQWTETGSMAHAREQGHVLTLLTDGRVLVTGGSSASGPHFSSAEIYDPATGLWTETGAMCESRSHHAVTLLQDGRALIAGGHTTTARWPSSTSSAEIYDCTTSILVLFDAQGGSEANGQRYGTNSTYGTLPTTVRTGYEFIGWYTAATSGTQVSSSTPVPETNHTLYAHWSANTYTVDFDPQGGSVDPTSITVTYDEPYGALPTAALTGYDFSGWWTSAGGTGVQVTPQTLVSITSTQTLFAAWTPAESSVTLNANGGSGGTNVVATYDAAMPTAAAPTRAGYTFSGYSDLPEGGVQYYTPSMASARDWDKVGSATLYAQWISKGTLRFQELVYSAAENQAAAILTVERVGGTNGQAWVDVRAIAGTATTNSDFVPGISFLNWSDGQAGPKSVFVEVLDDETYEGNETFFAVLTNAFGAVIDAPATATVTIVDNEGAPSRILRFSGSLDYGDVGTNTVQIRTVDVWNDGNQLLSVTNVLLPVGFATTQNVFTVPAGETVPLDVEFAPTELITYNGLLTLESDATSGTNSLAVSGTGVVPPPPVGVRTTTGQVAIIVIDIPDGATLLGVEDTLGPGLIPLSISDGGIWDAVNRKVKWFFTAPGQIRDRALQYRVSGPGSVVSGLVNFGTGNTPITGDTDFAAGDGPGLLHPADADGNWQINLEEISAAVSRWKTGQERQKVAIVVRGITIYLAGEQYVYDDQVAAEAKRWIPVGGEQPAGPAIESFPSGPSVESGGSVTGAVRSVETTNVTISVTTGDGTTAWGLEESVPSGIEVNGGSISHSGSWDAVNRKVKWAIFNGNDATLTYSLSGDAGTKATLNGEASFDGSEQTVDGSGAVAVPLPFLIWADRNGLTGTAEVVFSAFNDEYGQPNGLVYAINPYLEPGQQVLIIRLLDGQPVLETVVQDPSTLPFVDISLIGTTNLNAGPWNLLPIQAADQSGLTNRCRWLPPTTAQGFYRLKSTPK